MTQVTKESLAKRIAELESGPRSLKEDYQLEAFKMLLAVICAIETVQLHDIAELSRNPYESYRCIEEDDYGDYVKIDDITDALGVAKRCR